MVQGYLHIQGPFTLKTWAFPPRTHSCSKKDLWLLKRFNIFHLQLLRISPSLDSFVSCATTTKIPKGMWKSVFFHIYQHCFGLQSARLRDLQKVIALSRSHCTFSKKSGQFERLGLLRRIFLNVFFQSHKQIHTGREIWNRSDLVLKDWRLVFLSNSML